MPSIVSVGDGRSPLAPQTEDDYWDSRHENIEAGAYVARPASLKTRGKLDKQMRPSSRLFRSPGEPRRSSIYETDHRLAMN